MRNQFSVIFLCTITCSLLSELQTMDVWATFQSFLGNCPLPSKSASSFQVPLSSAKGKFLFLGVKKSLMQSCLKALRLLGHPMALSKQRSDEFMYTSRTKGWHSNKNKQQLNKAKACRRIHFGLCRTQSLRNGSEVQNHGWVYRAVV